MWKEEIIDFCSSIINFEMSYFFWHHILKNKVERRFNIRFGSNFYKLKFLVIFQKIWLSIRRISYLIGRICARAANVWSSSSNPNDMESNMRKMQIWKTTSKRHVERCTFREKVLLAEDCVGKPALTNENGARTKAVITTQHRVLGS